MMRFSFAFLLNCLIQSNAHLNPIALLSQRVRLTTTMIVTIPSILSPYRVNYLFDPDVTHDIESTYIHQGTCIA